MTKRPQQLPSLLIVEDSDEDFEALSRIIDFPREQILIRSGIEVGRQYSSLPLAIHRCIDGDDAIDFLNRAGKYRDVNNMPRPHLIILDLNLPGTDGREVLTTIKQSEALKTIPVVILSTSSNPQDIAACYQAGANSYMLKSMNINELKESMQMLLDYWFKAMILPVSDVSGTFSGANRHLLKRRS